MRTYTNLAWPDDPYRTGQQLYPRPAPRLAAFTAARAGAGSRLVCQSAAVVYLPLHRTRALAVTGQTVAFGFRAASIDGEAETTALAQVADLDLMQARRHAAILAGHLLTGELAALRAMAPHSALRGVTAVEQEWADRRTPPRGRAVMVDCGLDLPGTQSFEQAYQQARIIPLAERAVGGPAAPGPGELAAAVAVERALIIALVCARHLDRYTWQGVLDIGEIMAAGAWDCFPHLPTGPAGPVPDSRSSASTPAAPGPPTESHE
jgi:hypothetical protein